MGGFLSFCIDEVGGFLLVTETTLRVFFHLFLWQPRREKRLVFGLQDPDRNCAYDKVKVHEKGRLIIFIVNVPTRFFVFLEVSDFQSDPTRIILALVG